jgi:chemotaxis protein histidine kinase CheA
MLSVTELLSRAKLAIESGETSLRNAAEDIASAQEKGATQRQIAEAVGKSLGWVNRLRQWRKSGYLDDTAFGRQCRASRQRAHRVHSTEQVKRNATTSEPAQADAGRASAEKAKAEAEKAKADAQKAKADAAKAKAEARAAKEQEKAYRTFRRKSGSNLNKVDYRQRDRLVKLLGMLGSHHDGERANAAQQVEQHRAALCLTWDELIIPAAVEIKARAA